MVVTDEPHARNSEEEEAWQTARQIVLGRDERRCRQCSASGTREEPLHVHHLVPRSGGGPDLAGNLIALCPACHATRHSNMLGSLARRFIERWAITIARLVRHDIPAEVDALGPALRQLRADRLREGQMEIIMAALRGESLLAVLPTGFGKSMCFQLPALMKDGCSLVVSPLKALMANQVQGLFQLQVPAMFINGDLSPQERKIGYELFESGALKLLYVAPERFEAQLLRDPTETQRLLDSRPAFLVVDEAHCIDRWGDDFRPAYAHLGEVRRQLGNPPVLAFTATAGKEAQDRILDSLGAPEAQRFVRDVDRPNISFARIEDSNLTSRAELIFRLHRHLGGRAMIFVPTVQQGNAAVEALHAAGLGVPFYHGQLAPNERELILARFEGRNEPRTQMVVCTNAFGMGIDIPDVRLVIHWAHPASIEDYVQEAGRAGRDGMPSLALLFHSARDVGLHEFMAQKTVEQPNLTLNERERLLARKKHSIHQMSLLASQRACVRQRMVEYFGGERKQRRGLVAWLLDLVFSRRRKIRRSNWCCDWCDPGWMARVYF